MTHLTAAIQERNVSAINGRNPLWGRRNLLFLTASRHVSNGYFCARIPGAISRLWREGGEYKTLRGNKPACLRTGFEPPATSAVVESLIGGVVKRYPEGFDMTNQANTRTLSVSDLEKYPKDTEPRICVRRLGERLGFERPRKIRDLVERNLEELRTYGPTPHRGAMVEIGSGAVREVQEYWLNEEQAMLICMFARTDQAAEVRREVIRVFMAWRRGSLPTRLPRWTPTRSDIRDINSRASQILQTRFSAVRDALLAQIKQDRAAGHVRPLSDYSVEPTALIAANDTDQPAMPGLAQPGEGQALFRIDGELVLIDVTAASPVPHQDVIAIPVADGNGPDRFTIEGDVPAASWFDRCHLAKPRNSRDLIRPVVVVIGTIVKEGCNAKTQMDGDNSGDHRGFDHDGV